MPDPIEVVKQKLSPMGNAEAASSLYCPYCGYDLRTLTTEACPECGGAVDEASLKKVQVPWQSREEIGRIRAFIRTAWRVTFKTKRFCYAVCRPVSYADARRFQMGVVVLLLMSFVAMVTLSFVINFEEAVQSFETIGWGLSIGYAVAGVLGMLLFLIMGTGVHTYWFHPKHLPVQRQNRAVALGYYASGPLLLVVLGAILLAATVLVIGLLVAGGIQLHDTVLIGLMSMGWLMMVLGVAAFWRVCFVMAGEVADRGMPGRFSLLVLQPVIIAVLAMLLPMGLPLLVLYLHVIAQTF